MSHITDHDMLLRACNAAAERSHASPQYCAYLSLHLPSNLACLATLPVVTSAQWPAMKVQSLQSQTWLNVQCLRRCHTQAVNKQCCQGVQDVVTLQMQWQSSCKEERAQTPAWEALPSCGALLPEGSPQHHHLNPLTHTALVTCN